MKPVKIQCKDCGDVIFSKYPGHFCNCKCDKDDYIFIDQTNSYIRMGGRREKMIEVHDDAD